MRQGIRLILETAEDIRVVCEAADGSHVLQAVREYRPDIVLTDVNMPKVDGIRVTAEITALRHRPRVVVLTAHALDESLHAALMAGADGFILKDITPFELIAAVRTVMAGDALISPSMTRRLIERYNRSTAVRSAQAQRRLAALPNDQRYILALLAQGLSNAQMGVELGISESRVKAQVSQVLHALQLTNRVQAATLACAAGMLDQGTGQHHEGW